jgi:hypothetical protein
MPIKLLILLFALPFSGFAQAPDSFVWYNETYQVYAKPVDFYSTAAPGKHTLTFTDSLADGKWALYSDPLFDAVDCLIEVKDNAIVAVTHVNLNKKTAFTFQHNSNTIMHYDAEGRRLFEYSYGYERLLNLWDTAGNMTVAAGTGEYVFYHKNGNKKTSGKINDGLYEGYSTEYRTTGTLASEGDYNHGKRHGEWIHYNQDGSVSRREIWDQGNRLSVITE